MLIVNMGFMLNLTVYNKIVVGEMDHIVPTENLE
jgi:hypothetical protein